MAEEPNDTTETPIQRALRLKKAAEAAKPKQGIAKVQRGQKGMAAGASRPWMKR